MGKRQQLFTLHLVPRRKRRRRGVAYSLAGLALAGALGWIVWQAGDTGEGKIRAVPPVRKAEPAGKASSGARPASAAGAPRAARPAPNLPSRSGARPVRDILEAQIALDRIGISSGSIDGISGGQTRTALEVFQREMNLPETGQLDAATRQALPVAEPLVTTYTITTEDVARLRPLGANWWAKSQQDRLDFETLLEQVAEKAHAHPGLLRRLNPGMNWTNLAAGAALQVPRIDPLPVARAARVVIRLSRRTLEAFDERGTLLAHFPCSIAQRVDKRPVGELHVTVVAPNPDYTFDPALFSESPEARTIKTKLKLAPGPNNPVGTAWIGLDRPGYGLHGTPVPEAVGRTESHGCFRLANWNAERLLKLAWAGMPVMVEP